MLTVKIILVILCSYFLGNITFARPVSKAVKDDITKHGSGNPGTMNMLRTFGPKLGLLTLFLDLIKGTVPCIAAYFIFGGKDGGNLAVLMQYVAGFSSFIGHLYPVVFKFKGGKGVATAAGIGLAVNPLLMLFAAGLYVVVFYFSKIASLTSMVIVATFVFIQTIFVCLEHQYYALIFLYAILILVIYAHRANIVRMIQHKENKIDVKKMFKKKQVVEVTGEINSNESESKTDEQNKK